MQRNTRTRLVTSAVLVALCGAASARSVLVLDEFAGGTSTVPDALVALGYNVVEGTLSSGQISDALAVLFAPRATAPRADVEGRTSRCREARFRSGTACAGAAP
jgi:hypothetical protein